MRQELQQLKPVVPYVQSYMRYASDFNRFLAQQKAGGQQAQPNAAPESWEKKFWSPPEYNPNWASMIQRDAQGNLVPVAGAPPDVVPKYMAYVQYQKDHFDKFMSNPIEYLRPIATEIAREIAQNTVREHFGQHQGQQTIDGFINSNAKTLYEIGPDGNVKTQAVWDPARGSYTQQRVLSKAGQLFADYARNETAWQAKHGIHDPQRIIQVAWQAVGRDFGAMFWGKPNGAAPASQPPPANPREQANQKFLTQNNTGAPTAPVNGNSTPFTPPPGTQGYVEPSEILRRELASAGLSLA